MRPLLVAALLLVASVRIAAQDGMGGGTRLLRHPAVSKDAIAFQYAGDLWITSRNGGLAGRLTSVSRP